MAALEWSGILTTANCFHSVRHLIILQPISNSSLRKLRSQPHCFCNILEWWATPRVELLLVRILTIWSLANFQAQIRTINAADWPDLIEANKDIQLCLPWKLLHIQPSNISVYLSKNLCVNPIKAAFSIGVSCKLFRNKIMVTEQDTIVDVFIL